MKQGNKIVSYVIMLSIVFVIVQTASLVCLLHISFRAIEKFVARKNLQFCINSLEAQLDHLNTVCLEWSAWDDTGAYIEGQKPQYIGENTGQAILSEKNIDVLCITDIHGKPLWSQVIRNSDGQHQAIQLDMFLPQNLHDNPTLWNHKSPTSSISGFCSTKNGVLMLSSRPVTNNTNSLPIHGTIILGRFLDDELTANIARQTCLDFKWWNINSDYTRQAMDKYLSQITPENPVYIDFEFNTAAAYTILQDINKKDAVLVKFLMTNELATYRDALMTKSIGIFGLEGLVFLICLTITIYCLCRKSDDLQQDTPYLHMDYLPQQQDADEKAHAAAQYVSIKKPSEAPALMEDSPI